MTKKTSQTRRLFSTKTIGFIIWSVCAFAAGYAVKSQNTASIMPAMPQAMVPNVVTGQPIVKDIRPFKNFIAQVEPVNEVDIKPQVSGTIDAVLFENGSFVEEGSPLFIIDKSRYEANVQAAQADLDKAKANVIQIENDYHRMTKLYKDKFLAQAELELAQSNLEQAKAAVSQAKANLKLAELDLSHATIVAPISGYIGKAFITKGNYIDSSATSLARIVQTNPIRLTFSVTDKERLQKVVQTNAQNPFNIHLILANGQELPIKPLKVFTESEVDKTTATMSVYVEYDNENRLLLPGNVLSIKLSDSDEKQAVLVSQSAVLQDSAGKYVMTIDSENKAHQQYIEATENIDNYYIVENGLSPQDTIILTGGQKVREGQLVKPITTANRKEK